MAASATEPSHAPRLDAAYLDGLFQGAGLAVVACETDGRILLGNRLAAQLFGNDALAPGAAAQTLFPETLRAELEKNWRHCLTALEPVEFRARLGGTDEEPIEYGIWLTPVLGTGGAARGVAVWFRDVTDRARLQKARRKQERLLSLGTLSGAVANHYNNLLCIIATSIEYAMNMNTMAAMRRALGRTSEAVARAASITRQLLAFAQADHRDRDFADFTETVLYYFDQNEARLAAKNIKLALDWQPVPPLSVPRGQFQIVLNNLVQNALDVMPQGGTLGVTLARRDEDTVSLSIADTGGGIREEDMEHVFEPFYTTKCERTTSAPNIGLGLAVVHGLVHEMGGTIAASNVPGRGARFDIIMPVRSTAETPPEAK